MVGYKSTTSAVSRIALLAMVFKFLIFHIKSPESLLYYQPSYIRGFKWKSKNSDIFVIGVWQLKITGFLGTAADLLWNLDKKFSFTKLVDFLYWYVKYCKSFLDKTIFPLIYKTYYCSLNKVNKKLLLKSHILSYAGIIKLLLCFKQIICPIRNNHIWQKQPLRSAHRKRRSENFQPIYRRTSLRKCVFPTWVFSCKSTAYSQNSFL